jgi:phospholipid/cholesterol/gamma-HCH transport system substrate-binding protein
VTYRGYPVGDVGPVRLLDDGVRVELQIKREFRVPAAVRAVVTPRSAVGEQYVDLRPDRDGGPYLRPGDVISRDRTSGPLPLETLLMNLDALVTSVNVDDLAVVLDELGKAFEGNELALQKLMDSSSVLINDAMRYRDQTITLIRDGQTALATQVASSEAIRQWAAGLARLASSLRAADPDLRRLFANGPPAAGELVALLADLDPTFGTLLGNLVAVGGVAVRRLAGIEHMLVLYPYAVDMGFTITGGDGRGHMGWVPETIGPPVCTYQGNSLVCPPGSGVRSANRIPRPSAARVDAATGIVMGADGLPLIFGDTGGQSRLTGTQSWKTMLLSGIAP